MYDLYFLYRQRRFPLLKIFFTLKISLLILLILRSYHHILMYYNIFKHKKIQVNTTSVPTWIVISYLNLAKTILLIYYIHRNIAYNL